MVQHHSYKEGEKPLTKSEGKLFTKELVFTSESTEDSREKLAVAGEPLRRRTATNWQIDRLEKSAFALLTIR